MLRSNAKPPVTAEVREPPAEVQEPAAEVQEPSADVRDPSADVRDPSADVRDPSLIAGRGADPDSDVLDLVANRDMTGALRRLMQRHGTAVYRYCREALRDAALAEDVHQQVFIAAFRDLPKFHGRSTLRTWLFAIARHRSLDAAKSRRRARSHVDTDDATGIPDPGPSPGESLDDARLIGALIECMDK